jgi:hypothetical protein
VCVINNWVEMSRSAVYKIPKALKGRFAVVKLWPEIKTAEDECIARIKAAAHQLGIECIEVHANGTLIDDVSQNISHNNVDFVLHLHYDTPKLYDAYSIVALWNPIKFYHEWGYHRTSRNLTTHDDFISCGSEAADHHVARMIRHSGTHLPAQFKLYHSTPDVVHPPSLGDGKLFYVGINWEAIGGGQSRHQEVLKNLDSTGLLRIYGPEIFQNTRVWAGYKSYVKEIPFDGTSMIDEIAKAGIALVLSSQAHKDSGLMSNRLFEGIAAGALIICDENPWAKTRFGDSLLYIDTRVSAEQITQDIRLHIEWAQAHPEQALAKIKLAQQRFKAHYNLIRNLTDLYDGLPRRQQQLEQLQRPLANQLSVCSYLLMPEFSEDLLEQHIQSVRAQTYTSWAPVLVTDTGLTKGQRARLQAEGIAHQSLSFFEHNPSGKNPRHKPLGQIIQTLLQNTTQADAVHFVAPNERLMSNHIAVLAGALQRRADCHCAATAAIMKRGDAPIHDINELLDFGHVDVASPPGYGRFIFRTTSLPTDLHTALPYLRGRPLAALVDARPIDQQLQATITIDTENPYPPRDWDEAAENEIILDYTRAPLSMYFGYGPRPKSIQATSAIDESCADVSQRISATNLVRLAIQNPRWVRSQWQLIRQEGLQTRLRKMLRRVHL